MGKFVARLVAAAVLGVSLVAGQAIQAAASTPAPAPIQAGAKIVHGSAQLLRAPQPGGADGAIVPGFDDNVYGPNDDGSFPCVSDEDGTPTDCDPGPVPLPFSIGFYGAEYTSVFLNNNGNLTFGAPLSQFTPESLNQIGLPMIAPFWADVDTRSGPVVTFGDGTVDGHPAFGVNWIDVGCFKQNGGVADAFQVLLIQRPDLGQGDWDMEFNYGPLTWESGQASGGDGDCLNGVPARAGYTSGAGPSCEIDGSGASGALLSDDPVTGLSNTSFNSTVTGRHVFHVAGDNGIPDGCGGYWALGDSYASGEGAGLYDLAGLPCDRSTLGWPWLLSQEYPAVPRMTADTYVACSGDTIPEIVFGGRAGEPVAQVSALQTWSKEHGEPGLVTATGGGNDLDFAGVLKTCATWGLLGRSSPCVSALQAQQQKLTSGAFTPILKDYYTQLIDAAQGQPASAAPTGDPNVVIVGYPNLFAAPTAANAVNARKACFWMPSRGALDILNAFWNAQAELNRVMAAAAAAVGVRFIPLGDALAGHELCTADSYILPLDPFNIPHSGHPNPKGQQVIAATVASSLGYLLGEGGPAPLNGNHARQRPKAPAAGAGQAAKPGTKKPGTGKPAPVGATTTSPAVTTGLVRPGAAASPVTPGAGLPDGGVGVPYAGYVWATGGTAPYTYSVTSGSLPAGLSLDPSTGVVSGAPTAAGTASFTVTVTDSGAPAQTATEAETIDIAASAALAVSTAALPAATVGQEYDATLAASGGLPDYSWSVTSGTLPAGLSLDPATGKITGEPTAAGTSPLTVQVTDSSAPAAQTATAALTLTVTPDTATLAAVTTTLPGASVGDIYDQDLTSTGGTGPVSWSVTSGSLPPGLSLDPATGEIIGVATKAGTFAFTARVRDAAAHTATESLSITIAAGTAPVIDTTALPGGTAGTAYHQVVLAHGGVAPYTWSVTSGSLPSGLTLSSATGDITGKPTASGSFAFTVAATDSSAAGQTVTQNLSLAIATAPPPPAMTVTDTVTDGTAGTPYAAALIPANGTQPYAYAVTSGALPGGLTLDPKSGIISGTPATAGTFTATITVTDSASPARTATDTVSITITAPGPLAVTTTSLPDGAVGSAYASQVAATGGTGADTFAVTSGALPAGLALDPASGIIFGTPTAAGVSSFTVTATDSATPTADTASASLTLTIGAPTPVSITTTALPDARQGVPYSQLVIASGGVAPYSWTVTSGSLPDGLTLNPATGIIRGTPTGSGASAFTVGVTDSLTPSAQTATQALTLTVDPAATLSISTTALPEGTQGAAYSAPLDAGGGTAPDAWSVISGALPDGLALNPATGTISGTPTGAGTSSFTVQVTDSSTPSAQAATQALTLTVAPGPPLAITATTLPPAQQGALYDQFVQVSGGVKPYAYTVTSGSLPVGLTLNQGSGEIDGTPTSSGTSTLTVTVTDSSTPAPQTASQSYTIDVAALTPVAITTTTLPAGKEGTAYSATIGASGGLRPYTFSVSSGSPPAGLSLNSGTGILSGTPTAAGTSSFTIKVTDSAAPAPQTATRALTLTVARAATKIIALVTGSPVSFGHEGATRVKATVTAAVGTPAGIVTVTATRGRATSRLCTATLSRSVATCAVRSATLLAPGTYTVTATYAGSPQDAGATAAAGHLTVTKEATRTTVTTSSTLATATVTSRYSGTPAGTVTFTAGRMIICASRPLVKGKATCSPAGGRLPRGVVAAYSGNADYSPSKSSGARVTVGAVQASSAIMSGLLSGACSPYIDLACPAPRAAD